MRHFPQLGNTYLICDSCGRAQRRPATLKRVGKAARPERDRVFTAIAIGKAKQKFKILVWGPAPGKGSSAEAKRKEIRDELTKMGHELFFSEDLAVPGEPINIQELVQAQRIHLVINLAASYGSVSEFENYGILLGERNLVFFSKEGAGGFTDQGTRKLFRTAGGFDESFSEDDLKSCALTLAAADWVIDKAGVEMWLAGVGEWAKKRSLLG